MYRRNINNACGRLTIVPCRRIDEQCVKKATEKNIIENWFAHKIYWMRHFGSHRIDSMLFIDIYSQHKTHNDYCYRRQFDWISYFSILLHNADDSIDVTNDEEPEQEPETDQQQAAILPVPNFVPPASLYNHAQETVYETSARLLFMAVKWAKNLPRYFPISYLPDYVLSLVMI